LLSRSLVVLVVPNPPEWYISPIGHAEPSVLQGRSPTCAFVCWCSSIIDRDHKSRYWLFVGRGDHHFCIIAPTLVSGASSACSASLCITYLGDPFGPLCPSRLGDPSSSVSQSEKAGQRSSVPLICHQKSQQRKISSSCLFSEFQILQPVQFIS
jgi:hypothetical protein